MNRDSYDAGSSGGRESAAVRAGRWVEWWFAARWRTVITWAVFAGASACLIDSGFRGWMDLVTRRLSMTLRSLIGYSPTAAFLEMASVFGVMCWFHPLCLRLGVIRSTLWIVSYVAVGLVIYMVYPLISNRFSGALFDAVLLPPMLGLPGLAVIGIRTRPWISPCAAIVSSIAVFAFWRNEGSLLTGALLANVPYAALMIYGTKPRRPALGDCPGHREVNDRSDPRHPGSSDMQE